MIRMLACEGSDAKMEIYLPQSAVFRDGGKSTTFAERVRNVVLLPT